jgi:hypothetical protein
VYKSGSFASVALLRAGYFPTAPLVPTHAFSIDLLEFYRVLNKQHRRLGLQPFVRAIKEFHGINDFNADAHGFSRAYDCFLNVRRLVSAKIDKVLGRDGPDDRLKHACPACLYSLQDEDMQNFKFLCAADGNMSLKRFKKAGASDGAVFHSSYFVSREEVQHFEESVQVRPKAPQKKKNDMEAGVNTQMEEDKQDADLELRAQEQLNPLSRKERGHFPMDVDPLAKTFSDIITDCAERWKANADDAKKIMWDCFDECGVFILICRHGHVLLACDIIQTGEQ